jgi:GH25 family lysozyme M1 (1,4-beta-N-acetylmuramidase)
MRWIDVSHHQGIIDFAAVSASGITGVIVKATEGRDHVDPRWRANWAALQERPELERGAYHMARFDTDAGDPFDAAAEATHFASTLAIEGYDGAVVPWVDVERYGLTTLDAYNVRWLMLFISTFERLAGRTPGIYTGRVTWADRLANTPCFAHVPLWVAALNVEPGKARPFATWPRVTLHQHSFTGSVPGIDARVDLDELVGGELIVAELRRAAVLTPDIIERPTLDLRYIPSSVSRVDVAMLQGALLGRGFGPAGLVGLDGLPDGKAGPKTRAALVELRVRHGLDPIPVCDGATWAALAQVRRSSFGDPVVA